MGTIINFTVTSKGTSLCFPQKNALSFVFLSSFPSVHGWLLTEKGLIESFEE
jgi:hypothetical protein